MSLEWNWSNPLENEWNVQCLGPCFLIMDKCAFMVCSRTILGFIVSKEGKTLNPKKIKVLVKMLVPKTPQEIQVFNGMAQFYICFFINFTSIIAPITKLFRKTEMFKWIIECQIAWEDIKNKYMTSSYTYQS
jgi:hypothetical protein